MNISGPQPSGRVSIPASITQEERDAEMMALPVASKCIFRLTFPV